MTVGRAFAGRVFRFALFMAVTAGAVAFVLRTRGRELGPAPPAARSTARTAVAATGSAQAAGGYYILFRLARARAEAQEESLLRTILNDPRASALERARASADLIAVARAAREESEIESVMAGQGFARSAVVISGSGAIVVVPLGAMSVHAAERIGTDLWNLAGVAPEHLLIRPRA